MKRILFVLGATALLFGTGCSSSLAQPFQNLKDQPITVYRLQNYEPPAQAQAPGAPAGVQLPPQIQQWLSAGAQMLPPGLLPPGLLPGGTPAPAPGGDVPRFHNFRILGSVAVTDKKQRDDVLDLFGHDSNFQTPTQSCMFAEFGFQFGQGPAPGAPPGAAGPTGVLPADVLVSLSCDQVAMVNYGWPYGTKTGLGPDTSKKIIAMVQKAFGG